MPAQAILYAVSHTVNRVMDDNMKDYVKNKEICRRRLLLGDFDGDVKYTEKCGCCDICKPKCTCMQCCE